MMNDTKQFNITIRNSFLNVTDPQFSQTDIAFTTTTNGNGDAIRIPTPSLITLDKKITESSLVLIGVSVGEIIIIIVIALIAIGLVRKRLRQLDHAYQEMLKQAHMNALSKGVELQSSAERGQGIYEPSRRGSLEHPYKAMEIEKYLIVDQEASREAQSKQKRATDRQFYDNYSQRLVDENHYLNTGNSADCSAVRHHTNKQNQALSTTTHLPERLRNEEGCDCYVGPDRPKMQSAANQGTAQAQQPSKGSTSHQHESPKRKDSPNFHKTSKSPNLGATLENSEVVQVNNQINAELPRYTNQGQANHKVCNNKTKPIKKNDRAEKTSHVSETELKMKPLETIKIPANGEETEYLEDGENLYDYVGPDDPSRERAITDANSYIEVQ
ncbi:uncharacterized protein [Watersipora subatra]|uniref:uncharacterized protein n=1 Tax=Watersipora subatra TaxID=2589382 RepID=UPI00355C0265